MTVPLSPSGPSIEYDYDLKLNWLTRSLYFSAGADVQLLRHCPNYDRVKLQGIGGTVLATALLAFISGSYAFYTVFGPNSPAKDEPLSLVWFTVACLVGLVWAIIIYNLDRFIVAATGHGDGTNQITFREFFQAVPRILMACLIGFVISKPLEIRIMKTEIDAQLQREQVALADKYKQDAALRRDGQIEVISKAKQELVSLRDKKTQDLETLRVEWNKAEEAFRQEFEGRGGTRQAGFGQATATKKDLLEQRKSAYEEGKARLLPEINEVQARIKDKDGEEDKSQKEYSAAEVEAQRHGEKLNGLIKRIEIAHQISPAASIFLTLMLIFIEVAPLFFKMMISLSPIDYLVENQKRLALVRRGIHIHHDLAGGSSAIQDVKEARYHEAELEHVRVVGKIEIDHELTTAVQQKFKTEVSSDIEINPSRYIERIKPADAPVA